MCVRVVAPRTEPCHVCTVAATLAAHAERVAVTHRSLSLRLSALKQRQDDASFKYGTCGPLSITVSLSHCSNVLVKDRASLKCLDIFHRIYALSIISSMRKSSINHVINSELTPRIVMSRLSKHCEIAMSSVQC